MRSRLNLPIALIALASAGSGFDDVPGEATANPASAPDSVTCPAGTTFRIKTEFAGAEEWCETAGGVRDGPYRAWFNADMRILKDQGDYTKGRRAGLWVHCDRFERCKRERYETGGSTEISSLEFVNDPYREVWEDEGSVEGLIRFHLDLDGDDEPELFLGAAALSGKGGGPFFIFKKLEAGYAALGEVFLYPGAFEMLPIRHNGFFDLRYCAPVSAESCEAMTFAFDRKSYVRADFPRIEGAPRPKNGRFAKVKAEVVTLDSQER